ncbi:hypothetical protein J2R96_005875 [Bradyrhizobium elkanii]|nr:hypothetical protein [Bradyrhizobium elkanii]
MGPRKNGRLNSPDDNRLSLFDPFCDLAKSGVRFLRQIFLCQEARISSLRIADKRLVDIGQ